MIFAWIAALVLLTFLAETDRALGWYIRLQMFQGWVLRTLRKELSR